MSNSKMLEVKKYFNENNIVAKLQKLISESENFYTSVFSLVEQSDALSKCSVNSIWSAAIRSATLKLPIDNNLGLAYIIPYGSKAEFQISYKGVIQLCINTGLYRNINCIEVYEDEIENIDIIYGELILKKGYDKNSQRYQSGSKPVGYYAKFRLLNGFESSLYMTTEKITDHAKQYSKSYTKSSSPWKSAFDAMAKKTVLIKLLKVYGPKTIKSMEMARMFEYDNDSEPKEVPQTKKTKLDPDKEIKAPTQPTEENIPPAGQEEPWE